MAFEERLESISIEAGVDLSTKQYRFMVLASDKQIDPAAVAGADCIGILQDKPAAVGRAACVATGGTSKALAGATVAAGAKIATDNQGRAITAASGNYIMGTAITGGAVGEVISVNLEKAGILP